MATDQPTLPEGGSTKRNVQPSQWVRYVLAAIVVVYVLAFMFLNTDRVKVDYVFFSRDSRLIYVILVSAVLGALAAALVKRWRRRT
jgi:uncharacterized integral membrane protein